MIETNKCTKKRDMLRKQYSRFYFPLKESPWVVLFWYDILLSPEELRCTGMEPPLLWHGLLHLHFTTFSYWQPYLLHRR